jgi:uncharacterized membrane protein YczE
VKRNGLPVRLTQLYVGLLLYGTSSALQVRSELGLDPWDVFHQGLANRLHLSIGVVSIGVGALVLVAWIPLRQRPGLGTLSNVVLVGASLDAALSWLPTTHLLVARIASLAGGIVLCAIATGLYINAHFGPGPRDGLMTGIPRRTRLSIRASRTIIEVTVLVAGWLLGGTVGVGTLAFAVLIGPLAQLFLRLFAHRRSDSEIVLVVGAGEPGGEPLNRYLELRMGVDEALQPLGEPRDADLLVAASLGQLLDPAVGEVHRPSSDSGHRRDT